MFYPYFVTFSINGFSHGTLPRPAMTVGEGAARGGMFSGTNDFDASHPALAREHRGDQSDAHGRARSIVR
jgi:hypothetical protein